MAVSVKSAAGTQTASIVTTLALPAFAVNPAAGDAIVVVQSWFNGSARASTAPSDSTGVNTYTQVGVDVTFGATVGVAMWKAENITGGASFVVTVKLNGGATLSGIARCITGQLTPTSYNSDVHTSQVTGTSSATSGNSTPAPPAGSLFIGALTDSQTDPASYTAEASWSDQGKNQTNNGTDQDLASEDFVNAAATVQAATWTGPNTSFGAYGAIVASFAPAAGGAATPFPPFMEFLAVQAVYRM